MPKPKEKVLIELDKNDLLAIIADVYGLDQTTASISVDYSEGSGAREPEHLSITVTGVKNDLNHTLGL